MSFYDSFQPPSSGYYKIPEQAGASLDLTITDLKRGKPREAGDPDFPVLVGTNNADGQHVEFACGSAVLYRLVHEIRPQVGQRVLITFKGYDGRVKLYDMQVAGGAAPAVAPQPAFQQPPVTQPAPGFPPQAAYAQPQQPPAAPAQAPWGQAPQQPPAQPEPQGFPPAQPAPWAPQG